MVNNLIWPEPLYVPVPVDKPDEGKSEENKNEKGVCYYDG